MSQVTYKEESPWHSLVWRSSCLPQSARLGIKRSFESRFGIKSSWVLGSRVPDFWDQEFIWDNHRFNGHADDHAVHHADFLVEKRDTREAEVMFYVKTYFSCEICKGVFKSTGAVHVPTSTFNFCWCPLLGCLMADSIEIPTWGDWWCYIQSCSSPKRSTWHQALRQPAPRRMCSLGFS